jgi:hypothetical protein
MKYNINESQVEKITNLIQNFLNSLEYTYVCYFTVDYIEEYDVFDINVFFDRSHVIFLYERGGSDLQIKWSKSIINKLRDDVSAFINYKFDIYSHVADC